MELIKCPKCKSDLVEIVITGRKIEYLCNNCSHSWGLKMNDYKIITEYGNKNE